MLSRKAGLMAAFALWTFALGVILARPGLVVAAVPVALYLAFALQSRPPHAKVELSRTLPGGQVHEGEPATVSLSVRNDGPRVNLEVVDVIPEGVEVSKGSNHLFATLEAGQSRSFTYTVVTPNFGGYAFGPLKVRTSDGGATRYEAKTIRSSETLRVYPEVKYLKRVELRQTRPRGWPGETVTRRAGQGMEFYEIRGRAQGEALRRVNWRATARAGDYMLNRYMNEAGGETVLILDTRDVSRVGVPPESTVSYSVRAAAALSYRLLRDRNRVGLLNVGRQLVRIPPGFGRRQFDRILAGLTSTEEAADDWNIDLVPHYVSLYFSRMVQVVLISPLVDWGPSHVVYDLVRRGYDVSVVSPSPVVLDRGAGGDLRTQKLARDIASLDREQRLSILRKRARVVDWDPAVPLEDALVRLEEPWKRG